MKYITFLVALVFITSVSEAKIWRINNIAGVTADFTTFSAAANSASVAAGDTLYLEPSTIDYATGSFTLEKRLVVVGPGYFLDPSNTTTPGNPGLQVATSDSRLPFFRFGSGAAGSKFLGVNIAGSAYFTGSSNITFEKVLFTGGIYFENGTNNAISFRKCFFNGTSISSSTTAIITNFVCENNLFYNNGYVDLDELSGTGNIFRNNSVLNGSNGFNLINTYVANNIFGTSGQSLFTNSTLKNNLFQTNQTLPGTATNNLVSQDMNAVFVAGTTGSFDSRLVLKPGSPAIDAGLTIGAVVTPDCGAYGGTDIYKPSGIPNIPSIYALTVPTSIPTGSATMNVTFSVRNNN
jgi:hypothetical protein